MDGISAQKHGTAFNQSPKKYLCLGFFSFGDAKWFGFGLFAGNCNGKKHASSKENNESTECDGSSCKQGYGFDWLKEICAGAFERDDAINAMKIEITRLALTSIKTAWHHPQ